MAGEASGDLHASNLMKALRQRDPEADFRCWGGDLMEAAGGDLVKHYRDLAFMGFWEVFLHINTILRNIRICQTDILLYEPDVLVLVDYPGFNLRMAEFAKEKGIKVCYYISPQIWAWKKNRIKKIKQYVDEMMVILPFEEKYYAERGMKVHYVGHPLLDAVSKDLHDSEESLYDKYLKGTDVTRVEGSAYPMLANAKAAVVASGTATLETAMIGTPQVVCYAGSEISYLIAKQLISGINYISLVNLIMDKKVVTELIQHDYTTQHLREELRLITEDTANIARIKEDYRQLYTLLGDGSASAKAADVVLELAQRK